MSSGHVETGQDATPVQHTQCAPCGFYSQGLQVGFWYHSKKTQILKI